MLYLLYGTKTFLIQEEIAKIAKKFDSMNVSRYDLTNDLTKDALEDAETLSLFGDQKLVICENANMFTGSTSSDSDIIEEYLKHINPNTILVFSVNNEKLDERKKITKLIKKNGKVMEFNDDINPHELIKTELKDYHISESLINLIIDRVGKNPLILKQEMDKLKLYKVDKDITEDDILNVTYKKIDGNLFTLVDYIVNDNKDKALELFYELINVKKEKPNSVVNNLASLFRVMYQSKTLAKKGMTQYDIAKILNVHPYRVKLALQKSHQYSSETLLKYLSDLADIDINAKSGKMNYELALELFILKK